MSTNKEEKEALLGTKDSSEYGSVNITDEHGIVIKVATKDSWVKRAFPAGFSYELKELLLLAWPLLITQLCMALLPVVSLIFCGQLDPTALGAVSLANSVINVTCLAVGMGLATACDTLFAQSYGSINKKQVGVYLQKAILILLLACFPCWVIHLNTETLLRLMGQDEEISRLAGNYLLYYFPAVPLSFLFQVLSKYIQNQNIVLPCVMIGVAGNVVNAALHWLLVYRLDLRTDGSAIAQVGANLAFLILILGYIWASKCYEETWCGWSSDCLRNWDVFLKLAVPGMMMLCLEWWCFEIGTFLAGTLSKTDLGVQSVIFYMEGVCFQIPTGLSIAASIRIGQYLGAGDADGAKTSSRVSYFIVSWWAVIAVIIFSTLRYEVPKLFSQDRDVINQSADVFPILAAYCVFESASAISAGVLRGCGRQVIGAVVIFIGYWVVALPVGIPLMLLTPLTIQGLWIGYACGILVESILFGILVLTTNWLLEAEQAQERAGITESYEDDTEDIKEETEQSENLANGAQAKVLANAPSVVGGESAAEPVIYETAGPRRIGGATQNGRKISRQVSRKRSQQQPGLPRRYSTSVLVSALHGKRFSTPENPNTKYVIPAYKTKRRFSVKYTPQIQKDVLKAATVAETVPLGKVICYRLLILFCGILLLGAGVAVRLLVQFPYDQKQVCIPYPESNGTFPTLPPNSTLPWCNGTMGSIPSEML